MIKLVKNNKALRFAVVILCAAMVLITMIPTANAGSYTLLRYGSRGSEVTNLQKVLSDKGYLSVNPTGYYGTLTQDAVIRFQSDSGLAVDGIAGNNTQTALYESGSGTSSGINPTVRYGSSGWAVTDLQQKLEKFGYYNYSSITGYFGSVTHTAVVNFQKANGLTADGIVGPNTWKKLYSSSVVYAKTVNTGEIADIALAQNGKPYVLGGNGPDTYDCSGLAYYAMINSGYSVDRLSASAYSQYSSWDKITSTSALRKGDLVFFRSDTSSYIGHMGVYIGGGQFVHASSGQAKVMVSDFDNTYWARNFVLARRVG